MSRYTFKLPDVGEGTAEAEIVAWHVAVGDPVEEDNPLVDVLTDKATVEMTSPVSGVILEIHGEPGDMAAVGAPLVVIETQGVAPDDAPKAVPPTRSAPEAAGRPAAASAAAPSPPSSPPAPSSRRPGERPLASPAVRRRAQEAGVALQAVRGSGPAGRISGADLAQFIASAGATPTPAQRAPRDDVEEIKMIGLRRRIAEKMAESKRRIPHFAYVEEVDVTEVEELRAHLNLRARPEQPRLTFLPFLVRAITQVLPSFPQINARFDDEAGIVRRHSAVHAGIATQTASGLLVPVVRHAEALDLWRCAGEIARLAGAARDGSATAEELRGSTITITSLGPLGGVATTPVINHPEVAIIGPNRIVERPVVRASQIVVRKMMNLSSSFDHRVVDGYDAAAFIGEVKARLEHPATLFL